MSEISQFPGRVEAVGGEREDRGVEKEFQMPHSHALSPFQKFVTVVELFFVGWLFYVIGSMLYSHMF